MIGCCGYTKILLHATQKKILLKELKCLSHGSNYEVHVSKYCIFPAQFAVSPFLYKKVTAIFNKMNKSLQSMVSLESNIDNSINDFHNF